MEIKYRQLTENEISTLTGNGCICEDGIIYLVSANGNREKIMSSDEIRIPGEHNVRNYLAAFEAVRGYVSPESCRKVAISFTGVAHRLEEVRIHNGVCFINWYVLFYLTYV